MTTGHLQVVIWEATVQNQGRKTIEEPKLGQPWLNKWEYPTKNLDFLTGITLVRYFSTLIFCYKWIYMGISTNQLRIIFFDRYLRFTMIINKPSQSDQKWIRQFNFVETCWKLGKPNNWDDTKERPRVDGIITGMMVIQ